MARLLLAIVELLVFLSAVAFCSFLVESVKDSAGSSGFGYLWAEGTEEYCGVYCGAGWGVGWGDGQRRRRVSWLRCVFFLFLFRLRNICFLLKLV